MIDRIPLKGYIVAARTDGLLARINAIFNGIVLSKYYNMPFIYTWVSGEGAENNDLSCISGSPVDFISEGFVKKHHVDQNIVRKCIMPWHKSMNTCSIITSRTILKIIPKKIFKKQLAEYHNIQANCQLTLGHSQSTAINQEIFEDFFSQPMKEKFSALKGMHDWSQWIAIHYRAGDVIYGRCRHGAFVRDRSLCLPVVEKFISDHQDHKIVIMGTPQGESLDELMELENKYPNVQLSPVIKLPDSSHNPTSTLCDAYLMSLCKKVICAGRSNMTQFAQRLSGVEIHIPSPEEQKKAIEAKLATGEISSYAIKQQAFIHYNLFMIHIDDPDWKHEKADAILTKIRELDPEIEPILLLRFLIAKKHGKAELADQLRMEMRRDKQRVMKVSNQLRPALLKKLGFKDHMHQLREIES